MPEERTTKNDRREAAREAARVAREKQKKREQLRRWLIPAGVTLVLLAIVAVVVLVIVTSAPAPQTKAGPKNMLSDGILFTGSSGKMVATETAAIPAKGTPTPTVQDTTDGLAHIVTYVDFSCPACQAFEATNSAAIQQMVESGAATLEVHPVAILDTHFTAGSRYSSRSNNVGACVANFDPNSFYTVMQAMYTNQPQEGTAGLTNSEIIKVVKGAGLDDPNVNSCINGETFKSWVTAAKNRATAGPLPNTDHASVEGTPTVLVNGKYYDGSLTDANAFANFVQAQLGS